MYIQNQKNKLWRPLLAAVSILGVCTSAHAQADPQYDANDLLLFFQNPTGSVGNDTLVLYSLGSTWDRFRDAATPASSSFGDTISLGNIGTILTNTYGADWTSQASSIFAGAAGQNGSVSPINSSISNGDFARTVYVTKPRAGAGTVGQTTAAVSVTSAGSAGVASAISGSNGVMVGQSNPYSVLNTGTTIDDQNPFGPGPTTPALAYTGVAGGVMGSISSSTYTLGSVNNVVLGLDLFRVTPTANAANSWETVNSIAGVTSGTGYFLGTVTISSNGDVNFVAIPEPSSAALLALGGLGLWALRKRKLNQSA